MNIRLVPIEFDRWNSTLGDALDMLPEDDDYPHALIELLARNRGARRKKIWLVCEDGNPVAVAPLLKTNAFAWQPVTQYIVPGVVAPAAEGAAFRRAWRRSASPCGWLYGEPPSARPMAPGSAT